MGSCCEKEQDSFSLTIQDTDNQSQLKTIQTNKSLLDMEKQSTIEEFAENTEFKSVKHLLMSNKPFKQSQSQLVKERQIISGNSQSISQNANKKQTLSNFRMKKQKQTQTYQNQESLKVSQQFLEERHQKLGTSQWQQTENQNLSDSNKNQFIDSKEKNKNQQIKQENIEQDIEIDANDNLKHKNKIPKYQNKNQFQVSKQQTNNKQKLQNQFKEKLADYHKDQQIQGQLKQGNINQQQDQNSQNHAPFQILERKKINQSSQQLALEIESNSIDLVSPRSNAPLINKQEEIDINFNPDYNQQDQISNKFFKFSSEQIPQKHRIQLLRNQSIQEWIVHDGQMNYQMSPRQSFQQIKQQVEESLKGSSASTHRVVSNFNGQLTHFDKPRLRRNSSKSIDAEFYF